MIFNIQSCVNNNNLHSQINLKDKALIALNDSITTTIKNGELTATTRAVEIDPADILNSSIYKTLSKEQQKFYKDVAKLKGLVSASEAELSYKDSIIKNLQLNKDQYQDLTDTSITFTRGEELHFSDTSTSLKWHGDLKIDTNMMLNLSWMYNLNIKTTFTRDKEKDLYVSYTIDDPKVKVVSIKSIKVPNDIEGKTLVGKFLYKNRNTFRLIGGGIIFVGGAYVGTLIAK